MKFHLEFNIAPFPEKINYSDNLFFVGSCFAENIAEKFRYNRFQVLSNPHGVLYHPLSISKALRAYHQQILLKEEILFNHGSLWHSPDHHTRFSKPDKNEALKKMNDEIVRANSFLQKTSWLFITFGSAFIYEDLSGNIVANCHKLPNSSFKKRLLSKEEIVQDFQKLIAEVSKQHPSLKIVFTLSPVRYIRDGVIENNLSKAILLQAIHQLTSQKNIFYFPAYELMMDDLRDYRFYNEDLVHPNELAINYIFEALCKSAFNKTTEEIFINVQELLKSFNHRSSAPGSAEHLKFIENHNDKVLRLKQIFPQLNIDDLLKSNNLPSS